MTVLITDPLFLQHETGPHPETPQRLVAIMERLERTGSRDRCRAGHYAPLAPAQLERVHDRAVVLRARQTANAGGRLLDADTVVSPESFRVALAAAGACCAGLDAVLAGSDRTALCLVRPPGHHATPTNSMGFCLFNNIA